ncbi:MAG: preprotein translocase subunit SecG [Clostridia bacterium]
MQTVLTIFQIIICISIIILVVLQESPKGASGALTGAGDTDSHFDKIKGRTSGAVLKKVTAFFGIALAICTFIINIV